MNKKIFISLIVSILSFKLMIGLPWNSISFAQPIDYLSEIWLIDGGDLIKVSAVDGSILLKKSDLGRIQEISLDSGDGSVWIAADTITNTQITKNLIKIDKDGNLLFEININYTVTDMEVNPVDGSLWIVVGQKLINIDSTGNEILRKTLDIAYSKTVYSANPIPIYSSNPFSPYPNSYTNYKKTKKKDSLCSITINLKDNSIWCATKKKGTVLKLDTAGNELLRKNLGENNADELKVDHSDGSVWVISKEQVVKLNITGRKLFKLNLEEEISNRSRFRSIESSSTGSGDNLASNYNYNNLSGLFNLNYLNSSYWPYQNYFSNYSYSNYLNINNYSIWGTTYWNSWSSYPSYSNITNINYPSSNQYTLPYLGSNLSYWPRTNYYPCTYTCTYKCNIPKKKKIKLEAATIDLTNGSLWVITESDILRKYDSSGQLERFLNIRDLPKPVKDIAINPLHGVAWVISKTCLIKVDFNDPSAIFLRLSNFNDLQKIEAYQDPFPPTIQIQQPAEGETIGSNKPNILISFDDVISGIDITTFQIIIDGLDSTQLFSVTETGASYQIPDTNPFSEEEHTIEVFIADYVGNQATAVSNFTVEITAAQALPTAYPIEGYAPLTVTFTDGGHDPQGTIAWYHWDFNADGSWDTSKEVPQNHTHTFHQVGVYYPVHRVVSSTGQEDTSTIQITVWNNPPKATASANPTNGAVPLTVTFTGSGTDSDGTIVLYEWDFDGDGTWDWSSSTSDTTTHTYTSEGTNQAVFRVTDNSGDTGAANVTTTAIRVGPPGSPTAKATANETSGHAPLSVNFNDNGSFDPDGAITLYEWDFDGDGTYDWSSSSSGQTNYTYDAGGTFVAYYQVTDDTGLTGIDVIVIQVDIQASLSIRDSNLTFNPYQNESININTSISGQVPVTILVKKKSGEVVRTLVNDETRDGGSYTDPWDGQDDSGQVLPDGAYYAVLRYELGTQEKEVDLTLTTGGEGPYNLDIDPDVGGMHDPFQDDFIENDFSISKAYEMTFFVGDRVHNIRLRTVYNREPFPAGSHTIYWDGLDDQGNITKPGPGGSLVCGIFRYELPHNAMYLIGGRPVVSQVSAEPNYYCPFSKSGLDYGDAVILSYNLSEVATIEVEVWNLDTGKMVRKITQFSVTTGNGVIPWDGRNDQGNYVEAGHYRLAIKAIDLEGNSSLIRYALVKLTY